MHKLHLGLIEVVLLTVVENAGGFDCSTLREREVRETWKWIIEKARRDIYRLRGRVRRLRESCDRNYSGRSKLTLSRRGSGSRLPLGTVRRCWNNKDTLHIAVKDEKADDASFVLNLDVAHFKRIIFKRSFTTPISGRGKKRGDTRHSSLASRRRDATLGIDSNL